MRPGKPQRIYQKGEGKKVSLCPLNRRLLTRPNQTVRLVPPRPHRCALTPSRSRCTLASMPHGHGGVKTSRGASRTPSLAGVAPPCRPQCPPPAGHSRDRGPGFWFEILVHPSLLLPVQLPDGLKSGRLPRACPAAPTCLLGGGWVDETLGDAMSMSGTWTCLRGGFLALRCPRHGRGS